MQSFHGFENIQLQQLANGYRQQQQDAEKEEQKHDSDAFKIQVFSKKQKKIWMII